MSSARGSTCRATARWASRCPRPSAPRSPRHPGHPRARRYDYGLQFTSSELITAVEAGVSLPLVVWNNAALGQIRDDMIAAGIPPIGVVGRNPDFMQLAAAYGVAGVQVRDPQGLTGAIRQALAATGPTLIEILAAEFFKPSLKPEPSGGEICS